MSIEQECLDIVEILESVEEKYWSSTFKEILLNYEKRSTQATNRSLLGLYGGMGSFSDLVLYKNGKVCIEENNRLDLKRQNLFKKLLDQKRTVR